MGSTDHTFGSEVVSPERLSRRQQELAKEYIRVASSSGILIGAILGTQDWDLRPLVIESGDVFQIRTSPDQSLYHFYQLLSESSIDTAFVGAGKTTDLTWIVRKFYTKTLQEEYLSDVIQHPTVFTGDLIELIRKMHSVGVIHGHVSASNLVVVGGKPVLLDYSFRAARPEAYPNPGDIPPELRSGKPFGGAVDLFGLGSTLRTLFRGSLRDAQRDIVESLLNSDPGQRPSLDQVEKVFTVEEKRSLVVETAPQIQSGRLLRPPEAKAEIASIDSFRIEEKEQKEIPQFPAKVLLTTAPSSPAVGHKEIVNSTEEVAVRTRFRLIPLLVVFAVALLAAYRFGIFSYFDSETVSQIPFESYWGSERPTLMREVAREAIVGDKNAQRVILRDSIKGTEQTGVNASLLRFGMYQLWEKTQLDPFKAYTKQDREILFKLALTQLLPGEIRKIPEAGKAHPGVILAVAGALPYSGGPAELARIPMGKFHSLPEPYGEVFRAFDPAGNIPLGDKRAFALVHLLSGSGSTAAVNDYLIRGRPEQTLEKLLPIITIVGGSPGQAKSIIQVLRATPNSALSLVRWFDELKIPPDEAKVFGWASVDAASRLRIIGGEVPKQGLSIENYGDLLKFPIPPVRAEALIALAGRLPSEDFLETIGFLATNQNRLSRINNIILISILGRPDASDIERRALLDAWFKDNPDPNSVLGILLSRATLGSKDTLNFQASTYLQGKNWNKTPQVLQLLSKHQELTARTLAYTSLDVDVPAQREILEAMAVVEPSKRLRELIKERLED